MSNISTRTIMLFALLFFFSTNLAAQFFTEDFDGGIPTDWTTLQNDSSPSSATSNWVHSTTGPAGSFAIGALTSTSAANGFALFDSDLNCSGEQDVWLISPSIDCSSYSSVFLQFETYYARFNDLVYVEVSNDNMMTWTGLEVFEGLTNNDVSDNPALRNIDISSVAGSQSNVHFAFRFLSDASTVIGGAPGCGYSWMVDDVVLTDVDPTPLYDMRANENFFAIYNNALTPASQASDMGFLCDIENIGQLDAPEVNLNISITDDAGNVVHTQDLDYGTVPAGFLDENRIFPDRFTPNGAAGTLYEGTYSVTMNPGDLATGNNEQNFQFLLTDSIFAKEGGTGFQVTTPASETSPSSTWATCYYLPNNTSPSGNNYACTSVEFEVGNAATIAGATVNATLYKWEDASNDGIAQATERDGTAAGAIVGNASYTIGANDGVVTLALENWDDADAPVWLEGGNNYIIAIAFSPTGTDKPTMVGTDAFDYGAQVFLNDSLDINLYNTFWNVNDVSFAADLNPLGFAPRIRMHVNEMIMINTENILSEENKIEIYPNPANEIVTLDLDLVEPSTEANVRITDATGRIIMQRFYENIQSEKYQFNVSNYAAGTYFVHFTTEEGQRTIRFVVSK